MKLSTLALMVAIISMDLLGIRTISANEYPADTTLPTAPPPTATGAFIGPCENDSHCGAGLICSAVGNCVEPPPPADNYFMVSKSMSCHVDCTHITVDSGIGVSGGAGIGVGTTVTRIGGAAMVTVYKCSEAQAHAAAGSQILQACEDNLRLNCDGYGFGSYISPGTLSNGSIEDTVQSWYNPSC